MIGIKGKVLGKTGYYDHFPITLGGRNLLYRHIYSSNFRTTVAFVVARQIGQPCLRMSKHLHVLGNGEYLYVLGISEMF